MVKGDPLLRERLARENRGDTFPRFLLCTMSVSLYTMRMLNA